MVCLNRARGPTRHATLPSLFSPTASSGPPRGTGGRFAVLIGASLPQLWNLVFWVDCRF